MSEAPAERLGLLLFFGAVRPDNPIVWRNKWRRESRAASDPAECDSSLFGGPDYGRASHSKSEPGVSGSARGHNRSPLSRIFEGPQLSRSDPSAAGISVPVGQGRHGVTGCGVGRGWARLSIPRGPATLTVCPVLLSMGGIIRALPSHLLPPVRSCC